ncbi:coiled-coil domain-containing protein 40 [Sphaeramia orbicularis]|uniref:coiled-coil domain-containing protein 40 n=1 Tax=Sphaeramia orbicularis TaxID=375764 RepID=UPI00117D8F94|nr:coiled-coil domain-containing protein 40 [Sphaeramia orbicularis]
MQSPSEGDREGEEVGEESFSKKETDTKLQDGSDIAVEDDGATVPPVQEDGPNRQQSDPEPDDLASLPHFENTEADFPAEINLVQENVDQVTVTPHLSTTPEYMEDQEPLLVEEEEEEEELVVLDPEHPLIRRQQAALKSHLTKHLERLNLELREKLAREEADAQQMQEMALEESALQEKLVRLQTKLEDHHQTKTQAEAKHQQSRDQLEITKAQYSSTLSQVQKAKSSVSQLQTELDNLMQQLIFTQEVSQDLRSDMKVMRNATRKAGNEKIQAEEQKLKQDVYVERLTKDMERLMQQIAMYEAQSSAQAEETLAAKEALAEAEMEMESVVIASKQLLQQWNSSLVAMRRRDEAFTAMQEAINMIGHQVISLDREIEGYNKSTTKEQELNEMLTAQLNWSQMDIATSKSLITKKQTQQEALQAHYSTCVRTLRETEHTLTRLTKETSVLQTETNEQRRQLEKESAASLELEDMIMSQMQQKLTYNMAAKYSQRLTTKMTTRKKDKISELWQLKKEVEEVGLESIEVGQRLDNLAVTQEALEEEIANYTKLVSSQQAQISSNVLSVGQNQNAIINYNQKISHIVAATGRDLSPMQIKADAIKAQLEELEANIKSDQQLWSKRQGTLVGLTQEIAVNRRDILKLQAEHTHMQQGKIRIDGIINVENREDTELEKNMRILKGDLLNLNTLLSKNKQLSLAMEQGNALMESEFIHRHKEAERESIEMQMKLEKTEKEKERLLNSLVEAEKQIMLWEKKIQLMKETISAVNSDFGQKDLQTMKAEIHRMKLRLNQLMKHRERLLRESEATVVRMEKIELRREAMIRNPHKQTTKGELNRIIRGLQRRIHDTHKHIEECDQTIRTLQESQVNLSNRLTKQKQHLIELCGTSYVLDHDIIKLQDTKDRNLLQLVALQSRAKKLQAVREGSYRASASSDESVGAALQNQTERMNAVSTVLHRVCEEFPQHQGALHRPLVALQAHMQEPETTRGGKDRGVTATTEGV